MDLSQQDKDFIIGCIERGESLPARFRQTLFDDPQTVELIWPGKTNYVERTVLPFQSIEQIDEPRTESNKPATLDLFSMDENSGRQKGGWSNKLIWGDNKLILSSLTNGPLRQEIEDAGGLKLVYIDPPFDVGADFSFDVEIGDDEVTKSPSYIEEVAYRDTWGHGTDSFISMINERLGIMRELLAPGGAIYVHCDWRLSAVMRLVLNEIFGVDRFINEIIWKRRGGKTSPDTNRLENVVDYILWYSKSDEKVIDFQFSNADSAEYIETQFKYQEDDGRKYRLSPINAPAPRPTLQFEFRGFKPHPNGWSVTRDRLEEMYQQNRLVFPKKPGGRVNRKQYLDEWPGYAVNVLWTDIPVVAPSARERLDYPTQKPEVLMERILKTSSAPGDLIADFFCGSGTTLAVAEKLGRKWLGSDLSRFAIHTTRKRLIGVQRDLKRQDKPYRSFEILNLGKYERQYFMGVNMNQPEEMRMEQSRLKEEQFLDLILSAYSAQRSTQSAPFHGFKSSTAVLVGPIDSPITKSIVQSAVKAAKKTNITKVDILGFEFEMGIKPALQDEARVEGVTLSLKYIPNDVFDKRAIDKGQVKFYDAAYVEAKVEPTDLSVVVKLTDFGVFYRQEDADLTAIGLKNGKSKVVVDKGHIVKIAKDKDGKVSHEVLTQDWRDWIDYWAVDFDYGTKEELIRIIENGEEKQVRTGGYIFQNEWQSYRTRRDRTLELSSAQHEYSEIGNYKIAIKVIDIFGNDTTKIIPVRLS